MALHTGAWQELRAQGQHDCFDSVGLFGHAAQSDKTSLTVRSDNLELYTVEGSLWTTLGCDLSAIGVVGPWPYR